jgi:hypothetical protein
MNTQRPEWNDANNALVGFGLSMVTLYHLRRYLDHLDRLFGRFEAEAVEVSAEVAAWLGSVKTAMTRFSEPVATMADDARKDFVGRLGSAFSEYRDRVYTSGFSGRVQVPLTDITGLCRVAMEHLDATIRQSRRPDGLYASYNLIRFSPDGAEASVDHLGEMLEGQVAALDAGTLTPEERIEVIDALFESEMYRADQHSFMLYPAHRPPAFLDKNVVPAESVHDDPLLSTLVDACDTSIILRGGDGTFRFHADFSSARDLHQALDLLAENPRWATLVHDRRDAVLETYESVFNHRAYTGRSGSMYGYEGIGSIYWHMVAKLLVAVQGSVLDAEAAGAPSDIVERLTNAYWRVRSGLGFNKTAAEFGAIPIDPYSHTPSHAGAQQPGMTGLVKEELLTRPLELGIRVERGEIVFDPALLRPEELLARPEAWSLLGLDLESAELEIPAGSLGATVCQVPVIVSTGSAAPLIEVTLVDGSKHHITGERVDRSYSASVFARTGQVTMIRATLPAGERIDPHTRP